MSTYKRRFGDRKDGRLVRSLPAFNKFMPYIMPTRNDGCNQYEESFEVSAVDRTLRRLRVDGYRGIGILHFLIAAYVRCVSMLPGVNRFVAGRRIYAADQIAVVMTVKRSLTLDASETTIKVYFEPTDTIFDVYRKMNEKIEEIKSNEGNNNTEDVEGVFVYNIMLVREDLSDAMVYDMLEGIFANISTIKASHNAADKNIDITFGVDDIQLPLHPGAEAFWKDNGYIK